MALWDSHDPYFPRYSHIYYVDKLERSDFSSPAKMGIHPRWSPAPLGDLKLTCNGSALRNPGLASVGGVICNDEGHPILSFSDPAAYYSVNKAELPALKIGLPEAGRNLKQIGLRETLYLLHSGHQVNRRLLGN